MLQQIYPSVAHTYAYELNKDMQFAAAHYIPFDEAGMCQNVHGHTYFVNITIAGNALNPLGFLVNFQDIKQLVHKQYDHTLLNEHPHFKNQPPSTEVVAKTIFEIIESHLTTLENQPKILQVFVRETPTSYVLYRGERHV
ncbi:6-carboxytetrahydropterin synthase QueD [Macrococcus sp. DPC7161]|uniref:6-carboxytetrahydropterin synthase QueD n=1 Tax=Macrococcus sp. DPC7161 TaxID=2507060 RepID=UPI00100A37E8|nr:6-carboxytetrahydropterin synthase QueD [Macrococcus sp. DPC7161]RXK17998.1 6-carboxytetrahydropterin synthase QueD [Macrococcus sp. DPC7161]